MNGREKIRPLIAGLKAAPPLTSKQRGVWMANFVDSEEHCLHEELFSNQAAAYMQAAQWVVEYFVVDEAEDLNLEKVDNAEKARGILKTLLDGNRTFAGTYYFTTLQARQLVNAFNAFNPDDPTEINIYWQTVHSKPYAIFINR